MGMVLNISQEIDMKKDTFLALYSLQAFVGPRKLVGKQVEWATTKDIYIRSVIVEVFGNSN